MLHFSQQIRPLAQIDEALSVLKSNEGFREPEGSIELEKEGNKRTPHHSQQNTRNPHNASSSSGRQNSNRKNKKGGHFTGRPESRSAVPGTYPKTGMAGKAADLIWEPPESHSVSVLRDGRWIRIPSNMVSSIQ